MLKLSKLIHAVWEDPRTRQLGIRKSEVKILAKVFLDHIGRILLSQGKIKLQGLFTLEVRQAKGRKIKNPQTGEDMYSKDYNKIGIIPSKEVSKGLKSYKKK